MSLDVITTPLALTHALRREFPHSLGQKQTLHCHQQIP
jgi:hypothetical protein